MMIGPSAPNGPPDPMASLGFDLFGVLPRNLLLNLIHASFPILSWEECFESFFREAHGCFSKAPRSRWPVPPRTRVIRRRGAAPPDRAISLRAAAATPEHSGDPRGCGCAARRSEEHRSEL